MKNTNKRGRKRTATLPEIGELVQLPHIMVGEETLTFLKNQDNLSEYVRRAIEEKRNKEKQ